MKFIRLPESLYMEHALSKSFLSWTLTNLSDQNILVARKGHFWSEHSCCHEHFLEFSTSFRVTHANTFYKYFSHNTHCPPPPKKEIYLSFYIIYMYYHFVKFVQITSKHTLVIPHRGTYWLGLYFT